MFTAPSSTSVDSPAQTLWSRPAIAFFLLAGLCGAWLWLFRENNLEDAFITFRYARHLAEGFGYGAWNLDGSRVDGSTSFLWTLWLAIGFLLHVSPPIWAAASNYAALMVLLGVLVLVAPAAGAMDRASATRAGTIIATYAPVQWYVTSGMEAVTFMCLGGLVLLMSLIDSRKATLAFTACATLLPLVRPEGIVVLAGAVTVAVAVSRQWRSTLVRLLPGIVAATAAALALAGFRLYTFGDWLPNTYYAKAAGLSTHRVLLGVVLLLVFSPEHPALARRDTCSDAQHCRPPVESRRASGSACAGGVRHCLWCLRAVRGGDEPSAFPVLAPLCACLSVHCRCRGSGHPARRSFSVGSDSHRRHGDRTQSSDVYAGTSRRRWGGSPRPHRESACVGRW